MPRFTILLIMLLSWPGCAPAPPPGAIGRDGAPLVYAAPEPETVRYGFADTSRVALDAGPMGIMRVLSAESGVAEVTFRRAGPGVDATVHVVDYAGRFENPGQGEMHADEGGITGAWTLRLDPRGRVEVLDTPSLSPAVREIAGTESLVRPLFVHLPGAAADAGAVWVDTVSLTERTAAAVSRARTIVTSTLVGDTLVARRRLALIRTESATQVEVEGTSGGVRILQRLSGTLHGTVLWDAAASMLVQRVESGELTGTLELPAMGFEGLPVEAVVRRAVWLRP